jgi:Xaa-Pro aminopeptidase
VSQVPATERGELRLRRIRDRLHDERLDGLLVSHLSNIRYLTGFTGSSALLLVEPGVATLFTDFRYEIQAREEIGSSVALAITNDGLFDELALRLSEEPPGRRIGFEPAVITVRDRQELGARCGTVVWDAAGAPVEELRAVKDPWELGRIGAAVGLAEHVLSDIVSEIHLGRTEIEIAAELEYRLRRAGSGPLPFEPIVAFGPRSALPHAQPGDRALGAGDLVLLDFGATVDGYCSDLTRVLVVGPAESWQRELHAAVEEACGRAIAAVSAGVSASTVDAAAREFLAELGLADRFGHSTGHGLGLEVHELPRLHRMDDRVLAVGNVVTIEPGVYLPGRGGIRLEQDVVVEADGCRVLGKTSTGLLEI